MVPTQHNFMINKKIKVIQSEHNYSNSRENEIIKINKHGQKPRFPFICNTAKAK